MKVFTDENGRVQIIVEHYSEEQVLRYALDYYCTKKHTNLHHLNLACEMYDKVLEEFIKDVEL